MDPQLLALLRCLQSGPHDAAALEQICALLHAQYRTLHAQGDLDTLAELGELIEAWAVAHAAAGGDQAAGRGVVYGVLGGLRSEVGDLDGAIAAYEQALDAAAEPEVILCLAELFAKRGGADDLQQAADLYCTLGEAEGNPDGIPMIERALDLLPSHAEAMALLEQYLSARALRARSGRTVVGFKLDAVLEAVKTARASDSVPPAPLTPSQPPTAAAVAPVPAAAPSAPVIARASLPPVGLDDEPALAPRRRLALRHKGWLGGAAVVAGLASALFVFGMPGTKPAPAPSLVTAGAVAVPSTPAPVPVPALPVAPPIPSTPPPVAPAPAVVDAVPAPEAPAKPHHVAPHVQLALTLAKLRGGRLSDAQLAAGLETATGKLERCYAQTLKKKAHTEGRLTLSWMIRTNGRVMRVKKVSGTIKDPALYRCTAGVIASTHFAKPKKKSAQVQVPVDYSLE
jgi:hypothetical protein